MFKSPCRSQVKGQDIANYHPPPTPPPRLVVVVSTRKLSASAPAPYLPACLPAYMLPAIVVMDSSSETGNSIKKKMLL